MLPLAGGGLFELRRLKSATPFDRLLGGLLADSRFDTLCGVAIDVAPSLALGVLNDGLWLACLPTGGVPGVLVPSLPVGMCISWQFGSAKSAQLT